MQPRVLILLCCVALLSGCGTYSAAQLPKTKASNLVDREEWEGLTIGARIPSSREIEHLFGADLMDDDVLPLLVYVENKSTENEFTILSRDFQFQLPGEDTLRRQMPDQVCDRVGGDRAMLDDYIEKHFGDINLPANDKTTHRKAVFFRAPSSKDLGDTAYGNGILLVRVTRFQVSGEASEQDPEKLLRIYFHK